MVRQNRLSECWFTLGKEGKRILEADICDEVRLERVLRKQREHLLGINDVRISAELTSNLSYFLACWELPGLGWDHVVIPDAVFSLGAGHQFPLPADRLLRYLPWPPRKEGLGSQQCNHASGDKGGPGASVVGRQHLSAISLVYTIRCVRFGQASYNRHLP